MHRKDGTKFAEERDRLHLEMMSAVSHDLKTPLASIIGSLEIHNKMKDILNDAKKTALLDTAIEEAYRLDGFITNILDMARLDNGMIKVHKQDHDINNVVQDCAKKIKNRVEKLDVQILDPAKPIHCTTDSSLLNRAVYCLLDNAAKFALEKPAVQISYEVTSARKVLIHIRDNGAGVATEDRENIFSKYTRLAKKDYKNAGTGLGLTIARSIMKLLGGDVVINKNADTIFSGAWFTLSLPCDEKAATKKEG